MKFQKKDVEKLKSDNFLVKRNFFNKKTLNRIKTEFNLIKKRIQSPRDIHYVNKTNKLSSLHNIHLYSKYYKNFIKKSGLNLLTKKIYGSSSKRIFNASFFAKPANVGLETKIHQDNAYFNLKNGETLTCWAPLDAATKKNGTLFYYRGSAKLKQLTHVPHGNLGASMTIKQNKLFFKKIKKFKKIYVNLCPGDCVIHNALVVHGSKKNYSKKQRRAFNFSISSNDKINYLKFKIYKKKLNQFLSRKKLLNINMEI